VDGKSIQKVKREDLSKAYINEVIGLQTGIYQYRDFHSKICISDRICRGLRRGSKKD